MAYWHDFFCQHKFFSKYISREPSYFLFKFGYQVETRDRLCQIFEQQAKIKRLYPNLRMIFLGNTTKECDILFKNNIKAVHVNSNTFLDYSRYRIMNNVEKKWEAIYLARITPCKRHLLARNISSLLLVGDYLPYENSYALGILAELSHAKWVKNVLGRNVYKYINKAGCGLCLSEIEGAMFASAEYMLCGSPVVTTRSIGGREVFFQDEYVQVVDDYPNAVAEGVKKILARNIAPEYIRTQTIAKINEHRKIFCDTVQEIYQNFGVHKYFEREWPDVFIHKMGLRVPGPLFGNRERYLKLGA